MKSEEYKKRKMAEAWDKVHKSMRVGNLRISRNELLKILRLDPRNAAAYNRLGIAYAKKGRLITSTFFFTVANRLEPTSASFHNLGLIHYERKKYKIARYLFKKSLQLDEMNSAHRHIVIAKCEEHIGNNQAVLHHIREAEKIEPSIEIKILHLDTKYQFSGKKLQHEIIHALKHNQTPWETNDIDEYNKLVNDIEVVIKATDGLIQRIKTKKLNYRSLHTIELSILFMHNVRGCVILLKKNYSNSAFIVMRSIVEMYINCSYALMTKTYRRYAEIESDGLRRKKSANQRQIATCGSDNPIRIRLIKLNGKLKKRINSLNKRYKNLRMYPGLQTISKEMDTSKQNHEYSRLYNNFYSRGSDTSHANRDTVQRAISLSGTVHGGLFTDSKALLLELKSITINFSEMISKLPENSDNSRKNLHRQINKVRRAFD